MKSLLQVLITVLLFAGYAAAQNLVPNPGFESLKKQPCAHISAGELDQYINNWSTCGTGHAEIACDNSTDGCEVSSAPENQSGYGQETAHGGHNMGWVITCGGVNSRSYLGTNLSQALITGNEYYFEMYVSACDRSPYFTNNIGVAFFTSSYANSTEHSFITPPEVNSNEVVSVADGWVKISGKFTAHDKYTYMMIGNFKSQETTTTQSRNAMTGGSRCHCCYYVDDIVVRPTSQLTLTGDTLVNIGATARLVAGSSAQYSWVDIRNPDVVLGTDSILNIPVSKRTTFRVSNGDMAKEITVNVKKSAPVYQSDLNGRKVRKGRTVTVHNNEIVVSVHDKNEVDGDSISLYYGDSLVVEHLALTKKKQSFTIKVDKNYPRQIILYAENLGSVPPNTAELTIKDGKETTDIVLGSDFKWCDSIMILYKKED